MYIPGPVFELVLSYVTDGQPARRALARARLERMVAGWEADGRWAMYRHHGRCMIKQLDIQAYISSRYCGHAPIVVIYHPNYNFEWLMELLRGTWGAPSFVLSSVYTVSRFTQEYYYSSVVSLHFVTPMQWVQPWRSRSYCAAYCTHEVLLDGVRSDWERVLKEDIASGKIIAFGRTGRR
jgi:hypothetical protein